MMLILNKKIELQKHFFIQFIKEMPKFNIEEYINSLPDDIEVIDVSSRNLTYIPDLSRFTNLQTLRCSYNQLTSLPNLPNSLQVLNCAYNQLTLLPNLPTTLHYICCSFNQLTLLPNLPPNLQSLGCHYNQLTSLPNLPTTLQQLHCDSNQLTSLPNLPTTMKYLHYNDNPIYDLLNSDNISVIRNKLKILNKFRDLYYCIKYKKQLRKWLWKSREKHIQEHFHPDRLRELLVDEETDLDMVLVNWVKA